MLAVSDGLGHSVGGHGFLCVGPLLKALLDLVRKGRGIQDAVTCNYHI